jgi:squalene-hopene/tetraprenyl-beta-curcumene cyclase
MKWIANNYTLDENPGMGAQGLYYYYFLFAQAMQLYGEPFITDAGGVRHNWAQELADKLLSLQKEGRSWTNEADRWGESDPILCTSYAVKALSICHEELTKRKEAAKAEAPK